MIPSLTPLRGLAAVVVLVFHIAPAFGPEAPFFTTKGYLAVDLFFVLSGFVLAHVYADEFAAGPRARSIGSFLWARLARIYPVHLLTMITYARAYGRSESGTSLIYNLLLLQSPWLPNVSWNPYAWSISAEWHAYLLFPFVAGFVMRCDRRLAIAIALASLAAMGAAVLAHDNCAGITSGPLVLARTIPEFLSGMLVYRAYEAGWSASVWRTDAVFFIAACALIALAQFEPTDALIIALLPAFLLAAVSNTGHVAAWLNIRPLRYLGEISYSLYMAQGTAFILVGAVAVTPIGPSLGRGGVAILAFVLAILLGALIHRRIERPCREMMRKVPFLISAGRLNQSGVGDA